MSNMAGVLLEAGTTYHSRTPGFTPGIWWGSCLSFESTWVHPRYLVGFVLFIVLVFCVVFFVLFVLVLCRVYPMLPVSLDCPFLIAPSIFSTKCV
jgi:hypothetical protein